MVKRIQEFETVSELLEAILELDGQVDMIELPIRMGICGDFFPSVMADATHLLRVALSTVGFQAIERTHDLVWGEDDYGTLHEFAEGLWIDGWIGLFTKTPPVPYEWAFLVDWEPEVIKAFWYEVPNDQYTLWISRPAQMVKLDTAQRGETE